MKHLFFFSILYTVNVSINTNHHAHNENSKYLLATKIFKQTFLNYIFICFTFAIKSYIGLLLRFSAASVGLEESWIIT